MDHLENERNFSTTRGMLGAISPLSMQYRGLLYCWAKRAYLSRKCSLLHCYFLRLQRIRGFTYQEPQSFCCSRLRPTMNLTNGESADRNRELIRRWSTPCPVHQANRPST